MNHQERAQFLTPKRREDLDAYVNARFSAAQAAQKRALKHGQEVMPGSYLVRLQRQATRLNFPCLLDLMVWYELELKGPRNARSWRGMLVNRFGRPGHERELAYLDELLDMTRKGAATRIEVVASGNHVSTRTISRRLEKFARDANIAYSLNWLIFLHALHKTLQERPELFREG